MRTAFAVLLASLLVERGLSQRQFAEKCRMPASYPSRFLDGMAPPEKWVSRMSRTLGLEGAVRERFALLADLAAARPSIQEYVARLEEGTKPT